MAALLESTNSTAAILLPEKCAQVCLKLTSITRDRQS